MIVKTCFRINTFHFCNYFSSVVFLKFENNAFRIQFINTGKSMKEVHKEIKYKSIISLTLFTQTQNISTQSINC